MLRLKLFFAIAVIFLEKSSEEAMMSENHSIQRVNYYDNPGVFDEIFQLQEFIPEYLRESGDNIASNLQNLKNINMCMRDGSGKVFFYVLALPQTHRLVSEFACDDLLMPVDEDRYYIDQVVARGDIKNRVHFLARIVHSVFEEANRMGFHKFSVHALCENGIDRITAKVFRGHIYMQRKVTLSRYGNKDYVYMEAIYKS